MSIAQMLPAKRLRVNNKVSTYRVEDSPVSYYYPGLEEIKAHLEKEESFKLVEGEKGEGFNTEIPVYGDPISNWLISALASAAQVKARSGFEVKGETPETLSVIITDIPQTMEDLLAGDRAGGPYMKQKALFLENFNAWACGGGLKRPAQYLKVLSRPSLAGVAEKVIKAVDRAVSLFLESLALSEEEITTKYGVYLNALSRQLTAEQEEEDWDLPS